MKIKYLRSIAKSLADMAASSRVTSSFDAVLINEIETLNIDLLLGSSGQEQEKLPIVTDLHCWFIEQLEKENISISDIDSASLIVEFDYKSVATDLSKVALFHLNNHARIVGKGKLVEANATNKIWHTRGSA